MLTAIVLPNVRFRALLDEGTARLWTEAATTKWLSLKDGKLSIVWDRGVSFYGIGTEPADWEGGAGGVWVILAYGWELRLTPVVGKNEMTWFDLDVGVAPGYGVAKAK